MITSFFFYYFKIHIHQEICLNMITETFFLVLISELSGGCSTNLDLKNNTKWKMIT